MHIRCPHCRNPIEVVEQDSLSELTCPSCGSSFSLIAEDATRTYDAQVRRIAHFELLDQVGIGAFGAVWKARDTVLQRTVALKIPRRGQVTAQEAEYFFRDARAAAQLTHSGIVSVYEVGRDGDTLYIASKFIEGATLGDWIEAHPLTPRESCELMVKVAEAIEHAHERGVIHRDLKPGNILLDMNGEPHVADFGLAKRDAGEITMTVDGQVLGTPAYMSPEQAKGFGHQADARSDVYALGVILFELLTGELPFRGSKAMLIVQILHDEPPSPRKLNNRVPRDAETICLKAMAKEPEQRYATAADFAADLKRHLGGSPILARPAGRIERAWRWTRRKPVVAGLIAALLASLGAGTVASTVLAIRAHQRETQALTEWGRAEDEKLRADKKTAEAIDEKTRATQKANEAVQEKQRAEKELNRAEWLLYVNSLRSAQRAWEHGDSKLAWQYLKDCRPDLRGWEHDYLYTSFTRGQRTLVQTSGPIIRCVLSPEGGRILGLVSTNSKPQFRIWDSASGKQLHSWDKNWVFSPAALFFPAIFEFDGKRIVSLGEGHTVDVWDATNGKNLVTLTGHEDHLTDVVLSLDGRHIATASMDQTVRLWDAGTGQVTHLKKHDQVLCVAIDRDGTRLVSCGGGALKIWDVATGQEVHTFKLDMDAVNVSFSPDGKRIAVSSFDGSTLFGKPSDISASSAVLLSAESGERLCTLAGQIGLHAELAFNHDGTQIAGPGQDNSVKIWDTRTGREIHTLRGHLERVTSVAFGSDGKSILSASADDTIRLWDLQSQKGPLTFEVTAMRGIAFSPNGQRLVSSGMFPAVIDMATGKKIEPQKPFGADQYFVSPDATRIAAPDYSRKIQMWDAMTGQQLWQRDSTPIVNGWFSPDGDTFLGSTPDGTLTAWNTTSGDELYTLKGHTDEILGIGFHARTKRFVTGGLDSTLKVWDFGSGKELRSVNADIQGVSCVAFCPRGDQIASGGKDMTVRLWDVETTRQVLSLAGHVGRVSSVAYNPEGTRLVSGGDDGKAKVWDTQYGQLLLDLPAPGQCVVFNPAGAQIVTGGSSVIMVWDASRKMPTMDAADSNKLD